MMHFTPLRSIRKVKVINFKEKKSIQIYDLFHQRGVYPRSLPKSTISFLYFKRSSKFPASMEGRLRKRSCWCLLNIVRASFLDMFLCFQASRYVFQRRKIPRLCFFGSVRRINTLVQQIGHMKIHHCGIVIPYPSSKITV